MDTLTVLAELDRTRTECDRTGFGGILPAYSRALTNAVRTFRPQSCIEIGLANGISALAMLAGLSEHGGRLLSIDPYQSSFWKNRGVESIARAGVDHLHELREAPDFLALPELLRAGTRVDFAYIDGWHTFDYTLLDFWYLDRMLPVGGVVAFNDCGLRAVHRAIRFVETNRHYDELDVGLPKDYTRHPLGRIRRRLEGRNSADRYFRKRDTWEPESSSYYPF